MNRQRLLLASLLLAAGPATLLQAANNSASATGSASVIVFTPLAVTPTAGSDLNFGNVIAGASAGSLTVDPAGTASSYSGLIVPTGSVTQAAGFDITGQPGAQFSITLPATAASLGNGVSVASFTGKISNGASGTLSGSLDASGKQSFAVGGTLSIGANQAAGTYTGNFSVTVAYQ
jgi:hypothetical protein